ncbi:MAG: 50S ribosomal protein L11 methyltransferase [Bacteroidales bacterium]|nr:50S ribosomal protein L11 methyltransferase [Bacteroidales bacterium]
MNYLEFTFKITPEEKIHYEVLTALLGEIGFDSFIENEDCLLAYIPQAQFHETELEECINDFPFKEASITYAQKEIEDKNWNEEWEKNYFQPLIIDDRCVVNSTFHTDIPKKEFNIIINPQMSFGTGHHETTSLMMESILNEDFNDKTVLDMGCGTGILSILARMKGAKQITAIDIDTWCIQNAKENIALNESNNIEVVLGDAKHLKKYTDSFDFIFANINRNILLQDMKNYLPTLKRGGHLLISGFYEEDAPLLREEAQKLGLTEISSKVKNRWMMIKVQRKG